MWRRPHCYSAVWRACAGGILVKGCDIPGSSTDNTDRSRKPSDAFPYHISRYVSKTANGMLSAQSVHFGGRYFTLIFESFNRLRLRLSGKFYPSAATHQEPARHSSHPRKSESFHKYSEETCFNTILKLCRQKEPITWEDAFTSQQLNSVYKINEGAFGEVYCILSEDGDRYNCLKIVPLCGQVELNGYKQLSAKETLPELLASRLVTKLQDRPDNKTNCFIELQSATLLKGSYHPSFSKAWKEYAAKVEDAENEDPSALPDDQLFLALQYEYGGADFDSIQFTDSHQALSLFCQTALALAAAEKEYKMEHRDMHTGNILVFMKDKEKRHRATVDGREFTFNDRAISVRLIDFTLCRFEYNGTVFYYDFNEDPDIFEGDGSSEHHEVYRQMRAYTRNDWKGFHPVTNVLWLEYFLEKLLFLERKALATEAVYYLWHKLAEYFIGKPSKRYDEVDEATLDLMEMLVDAMKNCGSAADLVFSQEFQAVLSFLNSEKKN